MNKKLKKGEDQIQEQSQSQYIIHQERYLNGIKYKQLVQRL